MNIFRRFGRIAKANIYYMRGRTGNTEHAQRRLRKRLNRDLREKKSAAGAGKENLTRDAELKQSTLRPVLEEFENRFEARKTEVDRLFEEVKNLQRRIENLNREQEVSGGETDFELRLSNIDKESDG